MRPLRAFLLAATATVLSAAAPSCSLFEAEPPKEEWLEQELRYAPPRRDLLTELQWALRNAGYPPGQRDEALGRVESGWDTVMHAFSGRGRRYKGIVEIVPDSQATGTVIQVRVMVEVNTEKKQPLEPQKAKWEPMDDDLARAEVLLEHVMLQLRQKRTES